MRRGNHNVSDYISSPKRRILRPLRLLIADDSELIVDRLIASLEAIKGVEIVETVGTVERASEAVRTLNPDVVILDMRMPGGTGLDVLESMKRDQVSCVVIVLTNFAYPQYKRKCLISGATSFSTSPRNLTKSARCCEPCCQRFPEDRAEMKRKMQRGL